MTQGAGGSCPPVKKGVGDAEPKHCRPSFHRMNRMGGGAWSASPDIQQEARVSLAWREEKTAWSWPTLTFGEPPSSRFGGPFGARDCRGLPRPRAPPGGICKKTPENRETGRLIWTRSDPKKAIHSAAQFCALPNYLIAGVHICNWEGKQM